MVGNGNNTIRWCSLLPNKFVLNLNSVGHGEWRCTGVYRTYKLTTDFIILAKNSRSAGTIMMCKNAGQAPRTASQEP